MTVCSMSCHQGHPGTRGLTAHRPGPGLGPGKPLGKCSSQGAYGKPASSAWSQLMCTWLQDTETSRPRRWGWGCLSPPSLRGAASEAQCLTAEGRRWEGRCQQDAPHVRKAKAGQSTTSITLAKPLPGCRPSLGGGGWLGSEHLAVTLGSISRIVGGWGTGRTLTVCLCVVSRVPQVAPWPRGQRIIAFLAKKETVTQRREAPGPRLP